MERHAAPYDTGRSCPCLQDVRWRHSRVSAGGPPSPSTARGGPATTVNGNWASLLSVRCGRRSSRHPFMDYALVGCEKGMNSPWNAPRVSQPRLCCEAPCRAAEKAYCSGKRGSLSFTPARNRAGWRATRGPPHTTKITKKAGSTRRLSMRRRTRGETRWHTARTHHRLLPVAHDG